MTSPADAGCIAVITDDTYLPGTIVLLSSLLRHNPWFTGDIVVFHEGLSEESRTRLATFPHVQFRHVSPELTARLDTTGAAVPAVQRKRQILFSLEIFRLSEYDVVLKIDTDALCTGDVAGLMQCPEAICASPDQSYFRQQARDRLSYVALAPGSPRTLPMAFNAGVLTVRPQLLPQSVYLDLLERVTPETWAGVKTGHTDSIILNRYFDGQWANVSERFNYLISHDMHRYERPRAPLADAALVHYLGRPKPWQATPAEIAAMDPLRAAAFELWQDAAVHAGLK